MDSRVSCLKGKSVYSYTAHENYPIFTGYDKLYFAHCTTYRIDTLIMTSLMYNNSRKYCLPPLTKTMLYRNWLQLQTKFLWKDFFTRIVGMSIE